jgi:hypothetical protein
MMAVLSKAVSAFAAMYPLLAPAAAAGSLADIDHVVLFMQGTKFLNIQMTLTKSFQKIEPSIITSGPWPVFVDSRTPTFK